jgi:hypothetical protein
MLATRQWLGLLYVSRLPAFVANLHLACPIFKGLLRTVLGLS